MKTNEIMTKDPGCCVASDTAFDAAQLMKSENVGSIPVVNDNDARKLEGIVTDRDLTLKVVAAGLDPKNTKVGDVMTSSVISSGTDDNVEEVIGLMEEHQVRRIPIV